MQALHPNSHVSTVPEFTELKVQLPGASETDRGLTKGQFETVQRAAVDLELGSSPWGTAAPQLREHFGTTGRPDFVIVDTIMRRAFAAVADDPMTDKQVDTLMTILGVLCGTDAHFQPSIQARADQLPPKVRESLQVRALGVQTKGEFSAFLRTWTVMTGHVTPRGTSSEAPDDVPAGVAGKEAF
jgi:hypothetical protein